MLSSVPDPSFHEHERSQSSGGDGSGSGSGNFNNIKGYSEFVSSLYPHFIRSASACFDMVRSTDMTSHGKSGSSLSINASHSHSISPPQPNTSPTVRERRGSVSKIWAKV